MIRTFYKRVQFRVFWVCFEIPAQLVDSQNIIKHYQNIIELFPRSCQKVGCYGYGSCSYCRWNDISHYWIGTTVEFGFTLINNANKHGFSSIRIDFTQYFWKKMEKLGWLCAGPPMMQIKKQTNTHKAWECTISVSFK